MPARCVSCKLDVLSVPTTYREPKGLYVLEALANGVPVVQPRHGSFPELIEATGGGLLVPPGDAHALASALRQFWSNRTNAADSAVWGRTRCGNDLTPRRWPAQRCKSMSGISALLP